MKNDGNVVELLEEGATIQRTLKSVNTRNIIGKLQNILSKKCSKATSLVQ